MKKLILTILTVLCILAMAFTAQAADKTMSWDAAAGATGYKIYKSEDLGATWDVGTDVGNVTTYTYTDIIETGFVLFRISAYNGTAEIVRYQDFIGYNGTFQPPAMPGGYGMD